MKFKTFIIIPIILSGIFVLTDVLSGENIRKVKEIEFRGLERISKYDLLQKVRLKVEGEGIIIDINSLRKVLKKHSLVDKYNIEISGGRAVITIIEKKVFMTIAVKKGGRIIPFEIDRNFNVIAGDSFYSEIRPLVIFPGKYVSNGGIRGSVKKICRFINSLKFKRKDIYSQISEVRIVKSDLIRLFLFGRPTLFELVPDRESFVKLESITAYLDKIEYYPDKIFIRGNVAVVRN